MCSNQTYMEPTAVLLSFAGYSDALIKTFMWWPFMMQARYGLSRAGQTDFRISDFANGISSRLHRVVAYSKVQAAAGGRHEGDRRAVWQKDTKVLHIILRNDQGNKTVSARVNSELPKTYTADGVKQYRDLIWLRPAS